MGPVRPGGQTVRCPFEPFLIRCQSSADRSSSRPGHWMLHAPNGTKPSGLRRPLSKNIPESSLERIPPSCGCPAEACTDHFKLTPPVGQTGQPSIHSSILSDRPFRDTDSPVRCSPLFFFLALEQGPRSANIWCNWRNPDCCGAKTTRRHHLMCDTRPCGRLEPLSRF